MNERSGTGELSVVHDFERELGSTAQLKALQSVLPDHINVRQFCRLAVMSVQKSPTLLDADRQSLFQALQNCAVDGLIPDGREAALVEFNRKAKGPGGTGGYRKVVQYMPMVGGILKRARQSGQIASITARCVYEGDEFSYWIDEEGEHLKHVPAFGGQSKDTLKLVYAMAKLTNGEVVVEPMSVDDIEKVKRASRTGGSGPWVDWYERMAEKSVLHRIARRLPCSSDVAELMSRDQWMYEDRITPSTALGDTGPVPAEDRKTPSEDDALAMNTVMGRIMGCRSVDDLKALSPDVERLHTDFQCDAVLAVDQRRAELTAQPAL